MKRTFLFALLLLMLIACGCAPAASPEETPLPSASAAVPAVDGAELTFADAKKAETISEAANIVVQILEASPQGYAVKVMDSFSLGGEVYPGQWIYAVNRHGEWLDIAILSATLEEADSFMHFGGDKLYSLTDLRKNTIRSVFNASGVPHEFASGAAAVIPSVNGQFTFILSGHPFAMNDVDHWEGSFFFDGKLQPMSSRPQATASPENLHDTTLSRYRVYTPAETMDAEAEAIRTRLLAADPSYIFEKIADSVTVEGTAYPAQHYYAENAEGLWVDIILTDHPSLIYTLASHREEVFAPLRQAQLDALNAKYPLRTTYPDLKNAREWCLQDTVQYGYGLFLDGDGLSILDCGMTGEYLSWNEEAERFCPYLSRDTIVGVNYVYDIESYINE